jgi:hypothetical protein
MGLQMSEVWTAPAAGAFHNRAPDCACSRPLESATPGVDEAIGELPADREFAAMCTAYRATGGVARWVDLARLLGGQRYGGCISLPRLIASGDVFEFEWRQTFWVPMFQFELPDLLIKQGPRRIRAEIVNEFRGWFLATWFARPNAWLRDRRPVDLLDADLPAVLAAARADRFTAASQR